MNLISTLSLQAGHTLSKVWEILSILQILQVKVLNLQTCTLSKMPPASTINALLQPAGQAKNKVGTTIIRIIITRGATI
jgi:hypothetical protein